ncbi:MAG TPA: extracellular solute-binding protein [Pararhizobium sp.]|nr:extracellular solute-binding protein [Pararhizobium sp.]
MRPANFAVRTVLAALVVFGLGLTAQAEDAAAPVWHNGTALIGKPKYPVGFKHFDYVNPDAPKGGTLSLSALGSFDTLNPLLAKGDLATGLNLVFEPLFTPSLDEISSSYGLLAESVSYPPDISSATFKLRKEAKFSDGTPVTPEDVVWSFNNAVELSPQQHFYYKHVKSAKQTGPDEVTFTFDEKNNRELPQIVGQLLVLPKHWWEGKNKNGKQRSIKETTLEPPIGSGPYLIASVNPGQTITFKRNPDYWGKNLNVNVGANNFDTITYTYYADRNVEFQAFKSGLVDFWNENRAKRWATGYDFPAVKDGRIVREKLPNPYRAMGVMVGFIPNLRRPEFQDWRVRRALNYCFDFEDLQRTIFYGQYERINSYFFRTELAAPGIPKGREKEILESIKDKVPERAFTQAYTNPVGGTPEKLRANLRKAVQLFKEAGYEIRDTGMVNVKTGKPFTFQILLNGDIIAPVALAFSRNLKRIGITATVRTVDASAYINRVRGRDFDMIYNAWAESLSPGNEQAEYWGCAAAKQQGSQNYAGICDPGIDALIRKVIFAKDRQELVAATHALDRDLLAHSYVVPTYTATNARIAYWNRIARPKNLPKYSIGFPTIWWSKAAEKSKS